MLARRKSGYIGGGWQLTWKMPSEYCLDGQMEGEMERVYLHEGCVPNSENETLLFVPTNGKLVKATALVNKSVFHQYQTGSHNIDIYSPEKGFKSTKWKDLFDPGVKRALFLGVGIQILQQVRIFCFVFSYNKNKSTTNPFLKENFHLNIKQMFILVLCYCLLFRDTILAFSYIFGFMSSQLR